MKLNSRFTIDQLMKLTISDLEQNGRELKIGRLKNYRVFMFCQTSIMSLKNDIFVLSYNDKPLFAFKLRGRAASVRAVAQEIECSLLHAVIVRQLFDSQ